jgi:hypothetical protein
MSLSQGSPPGSAGKLDRRPGGAPTRAARRPLRKRLMEISWGARRFRSRIKGVDLAPPASSITRPEAHPTKAARRPLRRGLMEILGARRCRSRKGVEPGSARQARSQTRDAHQPGPRRPLRRAADGDPGSATMSLSQGNRPGSAGQARSRARRRTHQGRGRAS